jgi:hypothetical protein
VKGCTTTEVATGGPGARGRRSGGDEGAVVAAGGGDEQQVYDLSGLEARVFGGDVYSRPSDQIGGLRMAW